jgi:hypothetical protein
MELSLLSSGDKGTGAESEKKPINLKNEDILQDAGKNKR